MERLPETCSEILATLPLFVGYDLEAPEMDAVASHLEGCEPCRVACDRARGAREVLGSLREPEADRGTGPDLWAGVRSRLASEGLLDKRSRLAPTRASGPRPAPRPVSGPVVGRWAAAAAAALVLTVAGRSFLTHEESSLPDGRGPAAVVAEGAEAGAASQLAAGDEPTVEPGAQSRPMRGSLVGQGAGGGVAVSPAEAAPIAPEGSEGRALRRLEPGEAGLYEQALRERQVQRAENQMKRFLGIR